MKKLISVVLVTMVLACTVVNVGLCKDDVFKLKSLKDALTINNDIVLYATDGDQVGVIGKDYKFRGDIEESFKILLVEVFRLQKVHLDYINQAQQVFNIIRRNDEVQEAIDEVLVPSSSGSLTPKAAEEKPAGPPKK